MPATDPITCERARIAPPPEPREGLVGAWDRLVGPGATPAELLLVLVTAVVAALALPAYALAYGGATWGPARTLVAGLLAFDLAGGVVANATSYAKRWYHRSGQGAVRHLGFVLVHGVQIVMVAWLFRSTDWSFFAAVYGYLFLASLLILATPLYLQRPLAMALGAGARAGVVRPVPVPEAPREPPTERNAVPPRKPPKMNKKSTGQRR